MSSPVTENTLLAAAPTGLFVDGTWRAAASGHTFDVLDPATGDQLARVADAGPDDGRAALEAADRAQRGWARTAPRDRAELLRRAFDLVTARAEEFALLITLEMGKPLAESRGEVAYGAEFLRWFSEETPRISGRYAPAPDGRNRILVTRRPVGPALLVTPWNFPLAMATRKIAPALAAGCTTVLKPAEQTPLTALLLAQVLADAGLPAGVVNVVPTTRPAELTGPLLADSRLRKLSFTGSTAVGRQLIAQSADQVLRVSMELGGNAPFLVFADADLDQAVEAAVAAKMRNGGEACVAANRFLVQRPVAGEFTARLAERMSAFRHGRGTQPGVQLGPLISPAARDKVAALVDEAVADGARAVVGGRAVAGPGWFYEPTLLHPIDPRTRLWQEEVFGPVAPVAVFDTEDQAVALANDTAYGLVAFVCTRDLDRALRLGEDLEAGMVGVNTGVVSNPAAPFGGVKQSGLGREGGAEGIDEYLETVYLAIADPRATVRTLGEA